MKRLILLLAMLSILGTGAVYADTIKTADGTKLEGRLVETDRGYELHLANGSVREFSASDIVTVEFASMPIETYYTKAAVIDEDGNADAHFELAQWAASNTLADQATLQLKRAIRIDPDHEKAHAALGHMQYDEQWMTANEIMTAKGFINVDGNWMTHDEHQWITQRSLARKESSVFSSMDIATLSDAETMAEIKRMIRSMKEDEQKAFLLDGLTHDVEGLRKFCAKELARFAEESSFDALLRSALLDTKREVRKQAVDSLQRVSTMTNVSAEDKFIEAMSDERALVRFAATDALAQIGGPSGVRTLIKNYRLTYSGGPRSFIAFMKQLSYIEDYDVQVATGSTIADPVIGVLQTGTVLDAQPLRITEYIQVVERKLIWGALNKIRGDSNDQPQSLENFNHWWDKARVEYEKE